MKIVISISETFLTLLNQHITTHVRAINRLRVWIEERHPERKIPNRKKRNKLSRLTSDKCALVLVVG
jgi:hypothetical protein